MSISNGKKSPENCNQAAWLMQSQPNLFIFKESEFRMHPSKITCRSNGTWKAQDTDGWQAQRILLEINVKQIKPLVIQSLKNPLDKF